jgi:small-conductance mechanosensitive channel/CRP-like cAMP-binding protein
MGALLTKIGGTALGVIAVVVGLAYLAHRRQKSLPLSVVAGASVTLLLASAVLIFNSGVVAAPPTGVLAWLEFGTYLGVSFLFLKLIDLIVIADYLIDRKGAYIPDVVRSLIMLTGVAAASLIILRLVMNINVIALVALPTVATAVVGVALRDTLVRFFSGIALGKMIRVGDWIQVQDREGMVSDIGFGHVTLVTRDHDYVALPNNTVIQAGLINYNRPTATHACAVTVEAAYRIPPGQVCVALVDAASAVDGVLPDPKPRALVSAFNESGIEYRLRFSIGNYAKRWEIESAVRTYVWNALQRNGFEIPFPQRVVHSVGAGERSLTAIDSDQIVSHLAAVDFFTILTPEQIEILAKDARVLRFLPGEPIVRQGEPGQELFVILEGEAEVWLEHEGRSTRINQMHRGQFFGEMSLLTGEPRSATVRAVTPLKVVQVGKAALSRIVQEDQRIIERIGEVVARRQVMTIAAKEQLSRERASLEITQQTRSLIDRIQDFLWGRARA